MVGEIWSAGSGVGLAIAGLRQKFQEMKRLEVDMVAMDKPGFTRTAQESSIVYSGGNAIGIGRGSLQELTNIGMENELRGLAAQAKRAEGLGKYIADYEKVFGQMGGSNAFITSGNKVVTTINTMCSAGGDTPANKRAVVDALNDHTRQIKIAADKLQSLRDSASKELTGQIPQINQLLSDIASINRKMEESGTPDSNIAYLRQRRVKLNELAEYMEIKVENTNSDFLVYTPKGRVLVQGSLAARFMYEPPAVIGIDETFGAGTISLQSVDGDPTAMEDPSSGTHFVPPGDLHYYDRRQEAFIFDVSSDFAGAQGGSISGVMSFLQRGSVLFGQQLDSYAAGLRDSFNGLHNLSSAIQPRATLQGSPGYIGGARLDGALSITSAGTLRVAVINTTTNAATLTADIDIETATTVTQLCTLINDALDGHGSATVDPITNSLKITTTDPGCGISLGSVSGSASATITIPGAAAYGFSEFFHLNDVLAASSQFWRGGSITGLASNLCVNSELLSNPGNFSINKLREDELGAGQAVSGDPFIGRAFSDLFTRTNTNFQTSTGGTIAQTLEAFSSGLVRQIANESAAQQAEEEALIEAYKQQESLFSEEYGMDEQEIAIQSMKISKTQDLYFSFINNYYRMISKIAEMGRS